MNLFVRTCKSTVDVNSSETFPKWKREGVGLAIDPSSYNQKPKEKTSRPQISKSWLETHEVWKDRLLLT